MEVDGSNEVREVPPPPPPVDVSKPEKANIGFGVLKLGVARGDGNAPSEEGVELPRTRLVLIPPSAPPATISPIGPPPGPLTTIPLDEAETPARTNLTGQLKICKMCHKMNVPIDSQFKGCDVCREKRRAMYRQRTERKRVTNGSEVKIEELTYPSLFQPSALVTASPGTSSSSTAPPRLSESISTPSVLSLDSPVSPATMSASMKLCSGCRRVQIPISVKFKTCETCRAKHRLLPLSPSQSSAPSSSSTTLIGQDQDQDQDSTRRTRSSQRKRKAVVLQDNAADEEDEDEVKEVSPPPSYTKLVIRLPARKPLPVVVKEEPQQEELPTFS
ncbi:hypothetical protein DL96DRAFT_351956 [Flagelloscypha sp. PMI_526]|nr:hypothetical protein DL96DRAFT_351956 [Flagelloscypha sp. PMI_526]